VFKSRLVRRRTFDGDRCTQACNSLCDMHPRPASLTLLGCQDTDEPLVTGSTNVASQKSVVFFDDFLGSFIDSAKWTVLDRLSDQANHEVNCVVPENVPGTFPQTFQVDYVRVTQ
jgi:hypothetical protein